MPWKQSEESRTWQKERVIQELRSMVSTLEEIGVFSRCYRYSLPDRPCLEERARDWPD